MRKPDRIILTDEKKAIMIKSLKDYFLEEREEAIGDLAANLILSYIVDTLAPEFYNQGIFDAFKYMTERSEDLLSLQL